MNKLIRRIVAMLSLPALLVIAGCTSADPKTPFRVMTYNIHHGEGIDQRIDLERIAELIKRENADIVGLQEVDKGVERTARRDLPKELAELTGMEVYFDKNIDFEGGHYGNALLTKFPIKKKKNTHYKMIRPDEQRGLQQVVLDVHGKELLFMNTHIDYRGDDSERLSNVAEMKQIVAEAGNMPVILCGDFNDRPGSRTHQGVKEFLRDSWEMVGQGEGLSFSADNPRIRIDYIFISNESIEPLEMKVIQSEASDHLPVVGTFRFR